MKIPLTFLSSSADLCLRKWDRWPHRASARHTDSDCRFDLMLRWNKHKEVQYVHLCDPPSPHYCQMATYLWKEVSTNIDLHVSEGTKRWKNRRVFSISVIQQICSKSDKVIYKSGHRETQESHRQLSRPPSAETWPSVLRGCDVAVSNNLTKDAQVESFKTHLKYLLLWQHFESTQTQQQNSRMWFKSSQWSLTEEKITCSAAQCYLHFSSTLLLGTKMKRWDTQHKHTCLKLWEGGGMFSS